MKTLLTGLAVMLASVPASGAALLPPTVGGRLVAVDRNLDMLLSIDPDTLSVAPIGSLGLDYEFGGLAYDPNQGILYLKNRGGLASVNLNTGRATVIGFDSQSYVSLGLAFDSRRNQLLTTDQGGAITYLVQIDAANGKWLTELNEGTSVHGGMAYNAESDELYGARSNGQETQLWLMDRHTPYKITLLNEHSPAPNDMGLAYDSVRDYVWLTDLNGRVFAYDRNNNFQLARQTTIPYSIDALEYIPPVPEPTTADLALPPLIFVFVILGRMQKARVTTSVASLSRRSVII